MIRFTWILGTLALFGSLVNAADPHCTLWVAGSGSDNVVRFDLSSEPATVVAKLADGSRPHSLAIDDRGSIFVGLRGNNKNVVELVAGRPQDPNSPLAAADLTATIGRFGPGALAFDGQGLLNIAGDSERRVLRYNVQTRQLFEAVEGRKANLVGLAVNDKSLFVAEYFQKSILHINLTSDPVVCSPFIERSEMLDRPHRMVVGHDGNLLVSNLKSDLVQQFDAMTGEYRRVFIDVTKFGGSQVNDLHFNPLNQHYFISSVDTVYELSIDGSLIARFQDRALKEAQGIVSRIAKTSDNPKRARALEASQPVVTASPANSQNSPSQPPAAGPRTTASEVTRRAIPNEIDRQQAERQIREVFADELRLVKTAEERLALSRKLEKQGTDPNNTPEVRYVCLGLARSLAADAGDVSRAISLVNLIGESFTIQSTREKAAVLTTMSDKGTVAVRAQALAAARRELEELTRGEAFPEAIEMGSAALAIARKARDKDAQDRITESVKILRQRQDAFAKFQVALANLKDNPTDPQANLVVGRWWMFVKNNVPLGLKHLAASGDEKFAVAAADLAGTKSAKEQREIADQWRKLAVQEEAAARKPILARARFWYQRALSDASGLEKALIEKYLAELNHELGQEPSDQALVAGAPQNSPGPAAKSPEINDVTKSGWKPPQRNANTAFRSFLGVYLYRGDKNKTYPVVNLRVPNRNLWTQEIQDKVRGRISFDDISYVGTAFIAIPADGVYVLSLPRGGKQLYINDKSTGGEGDLTIVKGIHRVTFEVNAHYIVEDDVMSLRHKDTGEEVVFFNTWKDIQAFLATPIKEQAVLDVSNWKPTEADEVRVNSKSLTVTVGGK